MEKIRIVIIVLLFVVSANALLAGYSFMSDPSGQGIKASLAILRFSPFKDFFIPGLVLFTVNGIFNFIAAITLIRRWQYAALLLMIQGVLFNWMDSYPDTYAS